MTRFVAGLSALRASLYPVLASTSRVARPTIRSVVDELAAAAELSVLSSRSGGRLLDTATKLI